MNIRELLLPLLLAFATMFFFQYYVFRKKETIGTQTIQSGQQFIAPEHAQEAVPLKKEVDFVPALRCSVPKTTIIKTDYASYLFSTDGASLEQLVYKRKEHTQDKLQTIFSSSDNEPALRCFLVALNENTPFNYEFISKDETECAYQLIYKTETKNVIIQKQFNIYKNNYKIDLLVSIEPKGTDPVQARVFWPSPFLPSIMDYDTTMAVFNNQKGSLSQVAVKNIDFRSGWFAPTLFGAENKYFVNAMIEDENSFAKRAYYTQAKNRLISILEGPEITQKQQWTLSFYFGPKEEEIFVKVDPRLKQTLGHSGILAPISRFLLALLMFLFSYVRNYGWAIICLTILIKLLLLPFSIKGEQSMRKSAEMQKKLSYIQKRYKDDPELLKRERAEIMRKYGMPGLAGCLPFLIQMPLFFALRAVLINSIELYKAPFLWIPNLAASDPYYILPVLVCGTLLLQATTVDKSQRMMLIGVAFVFGALTANFSAGLALFLVTNTFLHVLQAILQKRFSRA